MYIKSNFRDYYDHQAYIYGIDSKIVYVRPHIHKEVPTLKLNICEYKYESVRNLRDIYIMHYNPYETHETYIRGIVIGDRFFGQIKTKNDEDYRFINKSDVTYKKNVFWMKEYKVENFINKVDSTLIDFCKLVNIPVFAFNVYRDKIIIDEKCPNLGNNGIASFITAEQIYQDLSYFIGNKMKDSPDMMKPVVVSDRDKIIAGGFDLRSSFRNIK